MNEKNWNERLIAIEAIVYDNMPEKNGRAEVIVTLRKMESTIATQAAEIQRLRVTLNYIRKELQAAHAYVGKPREIETWLDDMEERARAELEKTQS